jgi:hypothetical protein
MCDNRPIKEKEMQHEQLYFSGEIATRYFFIFVLKEIHRPISSYRL